MAAGVLGTALLAFALRALGFENVFPDDSTVALALADANYHARRAYWTLQNFPQVLAFDTYLNYPEGARVPWPPALDWAVAAVSLGLGGSRAVFERVAAWTPALLGTLAVFPIYLLGRHLRGPAVGIGAALLFACLPIVVNYGRVGNLDHHAAQAPLGALLMLLYLRALDPAGSRSRLVALFAGLVVTRTLLMLTWQGSLLYLGPGELALTLLVAAERRRDLLGAQALSALATLVLVAPFAAAAEGLLGGPYSAIELSRLHLLSFAGLFAVAGGLWSLERLRPARSGVVAIVRALALCVVLGAVVLVFEGPRDGLALALDFVAQGDEYGDINLENQPLFSRVGGTAFSGAHALMGYYAYLVPLAPLALAWLALRRRELRSGLVLLAGWSLGVAVLALLQRRYLNDFAALGSIGFALLLAWSGDLARARLGRPGLARAVAPVLGLLLLLPALGFHWTSARHALASLEPAAPGEDRALETPRGSLLRFAEAVREATPPTAGLYGDGRPEYAILCFVGIGHALHWIAERATPADNFGPYIGRRNFSEVMDFFALRDEAEALATARRLGARYLVTSQPQHRGSDTIRERLHFDDGSDRAGRPAYGHFRLVTEGPRGGTPLSALYGARRRADSVPYKLFELVEGAVLEIEAAPGTRVTARVEVETPTGRRFHWIATARVEEQGRASLRLPYATEAVHPARPLGPYRVFIAGREHALDVADAQVRAGATLRLRAP